MKRIYRESTGEAWIAAILIILGLGAGGAFVVLGAQQNEIISIAMGAVIGGAFVALGIAWLLKIYKERIEVSDQGIRMWSAPGGKLTFQCIWNDVISYNGHLDTRQINRSHPSIKAYTLQTLQDRLVLSAYAGYFPALHSHILSRLPASARVAIPGKPFLREDPIRPSRSWNLYAVRKFAFGHIFLLAIGAFLLYASTLNFDTINSQPATEPTKLLASIGLKVVGGLICLGAIIPLLPSGKRSIKLTAEGIEAWRGPRRTESIPWNEVKSVEFLYTRKVIFRRDEDDLTEIQFSHGPRINHHYAIIGTNGEAIAFSEHMEDFPGFLGILRRAAPDQVIFGTDKL